MIEVRPPAIGSVWKHYEGHTYTVVGEARHMDANIWMVVCRRQDDSSLWLFHRSSWGKRVSVDVPLLALATDSKSEIEELRTENERLRSVITSLMPGDAGRVE